jgi:hypothetical protein
LAINYTPCLFNNKPPKCFSRVIQPSPKAPGGRQYYTTNHSLKPEGARRTSRANPTPYEHRTPHGPANVRHRTSPYDTVRHRKAPYEARTNTVKRRTSTVRRTERALCRALYRTPYRTPYRAPYRTPRDYRGFQQNSLQKPLHYRGF